MIRRDLLLHSSLPPGLVLEALRARGREWRESAMPAELLAHGVHGIEVRIEQDRFEMRPEAKWTDRFELTCKGQVVAEGSGSVIRASVRQHNPLLWIGAFLALGVVLNVAREATWDAVGNGLLIVCGWVVIGGLLALVAPKQQRHRAELARMEHILQSAAWPPGNTGPKCIAVKQAHAAGGHFRSKEASDCTQLSSHRS